MKLSKNGKDGKKDAAKLTFKIAFVMLNSNSFNCLQEISEFEPFVLEYLENDWLVEPSNTDAIGTIWTMVKCDKHKLLKKMVGRLSVDKTIESFDFGDPQFSKIFRYLSDLIISYLERDPPYDREYLTKLTECMVTLAKLHSLDEELYVLEDMVSPAMWLLEKQNDEKIVANVKEFIRILH
jgi:hypothetical protein